MALARELLSGLQSASIRGNREYCGLIARAPDGALTQVRARRGSRAGCTYPRAPRGHKVVASYHTHGAFLERYDNEVPSLLDVLTDLRAGTNGYVSTPGGRLWYVDLRRREVRLICGPRCLPWDRRYRVTPGDRIATRYSMQDLALRRVLLP